MTYIHIDTSAGDSATIATDTWAYTSSARELGITDKCHAFPHRRMAVATQGDVTLGATWVATLDSLSASTYDVVNDEAPGHLRRIWAGLRHTPSDSLVLHVGWSDAAARFTTTVFNSRHDFVAEPLASDVFVHPTPVGYRSDEHQRERVEERGGDVVANAATDEARQIHERNLAMLLSSDYEIPTGLDDDALVGFAEFVRDSRAKMPPSTGFKVLVGGSLYRTHLTRDGVSTARLHDFSDEDLVSIMAGTMHPSSQMAPCSCGSDTPWIACHAAPLLAENCDCGSGIAFADCCALPLTWPLKPIQDRAVADYYASLAGAGR
ncbi:hypothetical protein ACNHYB_06195 [Isoptericola jiangsuensis]|uniref:hypothetical protein n=1 Tax=Isoptericola jiangsuensis TaxID=548579 RepID=UPI003AB0A617